MVFSNENGRGLRESMAEDYVGVCKARSTNDAGGGVALIRNQSYLMSCRSHAQTATPGHVGTGERTNYVSSYYLRVASEQDA